MMSGVMALRLVTDFLISCFIERKLITYPEFLAKFPQLLNLRPLLHGGSWRTRRERGLMRMWTFEKETRWMLLKHTEQRNWIPFLLTCVSNWAELKDLFPVFSLYHFKVTHTYLYYPCFPLCCWGSRLNVPLPRRPGFHSLLKQDKW